MMDSTTLLGQGGLGKDHKVRFVWMFGPYLDLLFFFLPVLVAPLIYLLSQTSFVLQSALWASFALGAFGLGDFHFGVTWFNYFDRQNQKFYISSRLKQLTYFIIPPLILALSILGIFCFRSFVLLIFVVWSVQHLAQQNVGLLLLYHNHKKNEAIVNRQLEIRTLHTAAIFFSLLFVQRILFPVLLQSNVWRIFLSIIGLFLIWQIFCYLKELFLQVHKGAYLNVSAFCFWFLAICFFAPFAALGKSYSDAILICNVMHWAQYIGIMSILVRRKYNKDKQLNDLFIPHPILLFLLIGIIAVITFGCVHFYTYDCYSLTMADSASWLKNGLLGFLIGMGMIHYYQDAFMWRFREPYYRETVLAYLRQKSATS